MRRFVNYAFKIVFSRTLIIFLMIILQALVLVFSFTWLENYLHFIWEGMTVLGGFLIIYIINRDEPTEFKLTWIIPICLFPVLGALIYLFVLGNFGGIGLKAKLDRRTRETKGLLAVDPGTRAAMEECSAQFKGFAHYMEHSAGFPAYHNTTAVYYPLGEDKFADLLIELRKAEKFIFLEYFIVAEGYMWGSILNVLKQKAAQGVEVRFMYDGMCSVSLLPYNYPKEIQKLGIQCKMFSPIRPVLTTAQNNRDHRKICVIDGKVGFTGGINLGDEYINREERFGYWKDTAVMLEGDAVQSLTMLFLQMWNATERRPEHYGRYLTKPGKELHRELGFVMPYGDSPFDKEDVGEEVYCHILNHAKKYVHIMTPYLILDSQMMDALCRAAKSGIDVKLIMPGIPDKRYAFALAKTYYKELIKAGVKIYEFTPGFVHAKVFVSDNDTATIGTINLDYRSLYLHFECGVFFYNNPVVRDVEQDFQNTLKKCRRISVADLKKISLRMTLLGRSLRLIAPLM